ncbi:uncharacterized protein LOC141808520 isoform X2 [Halichoeres trimaculatus]|uniref:uncharacterized protein LOC141808520 isoform X2 n=1 Tax=Halichoeres trimaculatus TaxID=147232 RepID=UPI003D9EFD47
MAGDCAHTNTQYSRVETFHPSKSWSDGDAEMDATRYPEGRGSPSRWSPNFEVIDGLLYRKKLEKGFINYREVLDEGRRLEALSTFHQRRGPVQSHLSLEETYKCVAENYWWDGMYFQIRDFVRACPECQSKCTVKTEGGRGCVTKTMASHSADMLSKLRSQREAGLFCDITLRTNGRSYSAHRAVLAAVSDHFQEIFTEIDSSSKADIDLTGFSEESLLSLLDFSYSSTLCVRQEDLPEVSAMARHLGMWPAVEACSALMKEQEQKLHPGKGFSPTCQHQQRESRRKGVYKFEANVDSSFSLTLEASDDSFEESPRRNLRRTPKSKSHNGLPLSPTHRMKLMDFKSPSPKKATAPRHAINPPQSHNYSPTLPSNTRLLRSTPGAAKEVQRLLPKPESPRRNKKPHPISRLSCPSRLSPVRVKQEVEAVGEDEEDYARAQEKYKLMNVLGLQRTALLPRPEDLIGWRQKKRLRKLKANNYSLTKRRKPRPSSPGLSFGDVMLSLPLCNPVNSRLLKSGKSKPLGLVTSDQMMAKRPKIVTHHVPPSDRSMRSKGALPDMFGPASRPSVGGRELRQSVRKNDAARHPSQQPLRCKNNKTVTKTITRVKKEPADYPISGLSSKNPRGNQKPLLTQRTPVRNKITVETVRVLRYNSGRPAAKAKLRRGSVSEVRNAKSKTREEGKKNGSPGQRKALDSRLRTKASEPCGLQFSEQAPPPSIYNHPLYKVIKEEPADPVPVGPPFSDPPSPDLGKRQSKPPIKLLDSGFLFSFCRPAGGAMAGLKKEEESVDICLTRSVSQVGDKFGTKDSPTRALRARVAPALSVVKREREERTVNLSKVQKHRPNSQNNTNHSAKHPKAKPAGLKKGKPLPLSNRSFVMMDAVRRARLKQLRGPCSQVPKLPKAAHSCLQCPASYKDCDALIMHRLRHIEGKHWPCLLCSKTFFRLRNVRNHIRTHDPKLYKCRSCIVSGS